MATRNLTVFLPILALSGCAALHSPAEETYIALRATDTAQTWQGLHASCHCYSESGMYGLFGRHPSDVQQIGFSAGMTAMHLGITEWLLTHDHPRIAWTFEAITIADEGRAVILNWKIGVTPWGASPPTDGGSNMLFTHSSPSH